MIFQNYTTKYYGLLSVLKYYHKSMDENERIILENIFD